ncbi:MAG TPA: CRISPR-associated ring nuclease Csm6 [Pyrinomonadaceae bacterium]|jgi:CRISPR-associated protein (TIGR02584 family)
MKGNILLCVAGLTPSIITETLHVLTIKQNKQVDEVRVITTTSGEKLVKSRLFDSGVFEGFCRDYPEQTKNLRFDEKCLYLLNVNRTGIPDNADFPEDRLPDIRTTEENEKAANQICEIVRFWANDKKSAQIFATVAGGRKTMGNYLAFAMSLFGRKQDTLSHVLVSEEFERPGKLPLDFYYEPPVPRPVLDIKGNTVLTSGDKQLMTDMAQTTLAEIPYVRLRRILSENYGNTPGEYASFVEQVQAELDLLETDHAVEIYLAENKIKIAKCEFELAPRDFWIYVIYALYRKNAADKEQAAAVAYDEITIADFDAALRLITKARGSEIGVETIRNGIPQFVDYDFFLDHLKISNGQMALNNDSIAKTMTEGISRINKNFKNKRIPSRYRIDAREHRGRIKYNWLAVSPDRIVFVN